MARMVGRLVAVNLTKMLAPGMYADGAGLNLCVGPSGARSWIFRFMRAGRAHEMGLGALHTISLKEARERARQCRQQLLDGVDPLAAKREARQTARIDQAKATTFEQAARAYIKAHRAGWKSPKSLAAWEHTLRAFAYPVLGCLPVAAIDTALVMKVLEPIWNEKPETANRLRGRLESILDYARVIGQRRGENPARWRGHLDHLLPARQAVAKTVHHPAMPYRELPGFLVDLRQREGVAALALQFAILTAARTGEIVGATWAEIDAEQRLWTIPASRMKAGREHRVPLGKAAVTILAALPRDPDQARVFPVSNMAMLMLLRRMGRADLTVHGFRSGFSDWCAEQTNAPSEVREMALAHAVGDKVEAAYRRGDLFAKRRDLAEVWARFCDGHGGDNVVVPLGRSARVG